MISSQAQIAIMVETIRESSAVQEENSDKRVQTVLDAERKRDDMFLAFQKEQAEANRAHEMMLKKFMMSGGN